MGSLASDIRHKFRGWVVWDAISTSRHNLSLSMLQSFWSGSPHSATANVATVGIVGDPADLGYAGNPGNQLYYFSNRGEFRFDNIYRTDLALTRPHDLHQPDLVLVGDGQGLALVVPPVLFDQRAADTLVPRLIALRQAEGDTVVYVRGDKNRPYGEVMEILGRVGKSGYSRVSLLSQPKAGE